jgi:hypothetical protein
MKILVNSYPRSGSTMFSNAILSSCRDQIPQESIEFPMPYYDTWITWKHENILLLGDFGKDTFITTIIRDPIDAISANVDRWVSGFTGNIVNGNPVFNKLIINSDSSLNDRDIELIYHQIEVYKSYIVSTDKNLENIYPFLYNQIKKAPVECVKNILEIAGFSVDKINESIIKKITQNEPTIKTDKYPEIVKFLKENSKEVVELYSSLQAKIIEKQKTYPTLMDMAM